MASILMTLSDSELKIILMFVIFLTTITRKCSMDDRRYNYSPTAILFKCAAVDKPSTDNTIVRHVVPLR